MRLCEFKSFPLFGDYVLLLFLHVDFIQQTIICYFRLPVLNHIFGSLLRNSVAKMCVFSIYLFSHGRTLEGGLEKKMLIAFLVGFGSITPRST